MKRTLAGSLLRRRKVRRRVQHRHLDADLLTAEDVLAILEQCEDTVIGLRNRTLLVTLWRTGVRISEALALLEKDIDRERGVLVVQHGKGGRRRVIGLDEETARVLDQWLSVRLAAFAPAASAPVFCTRGGGQIDPSYVRHLLPRLADKAAINKRVHSHAFRHLFALELQAEGAQMTTIRDLLGHQSLGTTDVYLRRLGAGPAVEFARRRTWQSPRIVPPEAGAGDALAIGRHVPDQASRVSTGRVSEWRAEE